MASWRRQIGLRASPACPPQRVVPWHAEVPRKLARLIESSPSLSCRMERDGHDEIGVPQDIGAGLPHAGCERPRDRRPRVIFHRLDNRAEAVLIWSDGARERPRRHRGQIASSRLRIRQLGRASPHALQKGGVNRTIDAQHASQTAPRVGASSGRSHAAHTGAIRTVSASSTN
jgi:hypothetical protein